VSGDVSTEGALFGVGSDQVTLNTEGPQRREG
jgi:hypothetical protein